MNIILALVKPSNRKRLTLECSLSYFFYLHDKFQLIHFTVFELTVLILYLTQNYSSGTGLKFLKTKKVSFPFLYLPILISSPCFLFKDFPRCYSFLWTRIGKSSQACYSICLKTIKILIESKRSIQTYTNVLQHPKMTRFYNYQLLFKTKFHLQTNLLKGPFPCRPFSSKRFFPTKTVD